MYDADHFSKKYNYFSYNIIKKYTRSINLSARGGKMNNLGHRCCGLTLPIHLYCSWLAKIVYHGG